MRIVLILEQTDYRVKDNKIQQKKRLKLRLATRGLNSKLFLRQLHLAKSTKLEKSNRAVLRLQGSKDAEGGFLASAQ